jgi:hypothetical protein
VSEIPFVNALGDEIERAAARRRGRIRRRLAIGTIGIAIAATGVAAASGVFSSPEQLAGTSVACYDHASLNGNVAVLSTGERTPIETCRHVLNTYAPLIACAGETVAVFPGGKGTCEKLGLRALPAQYATARARVNAFARDIEALEQSADCIPPRELAGRVQALLDRSGWTGWHTWLRLDIEDGPCGTVSSQGGDGRRTIEGSLDTDGHRVMVVGEAARSTMDLLYSGAGGLAPRLEDASGERCYTPSGLEAMARERTDRHLRFTTGTATGELMGRRGQRLREGCAVIIDVVPARDGYGIVVTIQG